MPSVWPSPGLHPERMFNPLELAHSDMLVLPKIKTPASRSFEMREDSSEGFAPKRAKEPADTSSLSLVAMFSLTRIRMPWRGLHGICQHVEPNRQCVHLITTCFPNASAHLSRFWVTDRASGLICNTVSPGRLW